MLSEKSSIAIHHANMYIISHKYESNMVFYNEIYLQNCVLKQE